MNMIKGLRIVANCGQLTGAERAWCRQAIEEIERLRDVLQRLFDYHDEAAPGCHTEYLAAVADAADILSDVRGGQ